MQFPAAVLENIKNKETVLFIGSGFSLSAGVPSARSLAQRLSAKLGERNPVKYGTQTDLSKAARDYENELGRAALVNEVRSILETAPRAARTVTHQLLASLVKQGFVRKIVTTNYDTLIEDACEASGAPIEVITNESQIHLAASDDARVLYKIHGDFFHPESLVLTELDYQRWKRRVEMSALIRDLQARFDRNALLFLGYSVSDFTILELLLGSTASAPEIPRHKRFAAIYSEKQVDEATMNLRPYDVETFHCPDVELLLRWLLLELPVKLVVKHIVFNYASWYPDQQAQYGGIETFISYLKRFGGGQIEHISESAYAGAMLTQSPDRLAHTNGPNYPASFFFFRAAARSVLEEIFVTGNLGKPIPDVIHMHFLAFSDIYEKSGLPTLCTSHSLLSRDLGYTKGFFDGLGSSQARSEIQAAYDAEMESAAGARFVTVVSEDHENEVRQIGVRCIRRLRPPFDVTAFSPEEPHSARMRAEIPDVLTISYVGRPDRRKGIEVLISACEKLASTNSQFQLMIVGYGFQKNAGRLSFGSGRFWFDVSALEKRGVNIILKQANDVQGGSSLFRFGYRSDSVYL